MLQTFSKPKHWVLTITAAITDLFSAYVQSAYEKRLLENNFEFYKQQTVCNHILLVNKLIAQTNQFYRYNLMSN